MTEAVVTREIGEFIDSQPLRALQWRVLLLCSLAVLLDGFDIQTMALAVPALAGAWQLPNAAFGVALSAALIGMCLGAALIAPLGDRWGRRPLIIIGLALVGFASVGTGLADNLNMLLVGRFLTGIGMGASIANATALLSEYAPSRHRAALVTLMFCNIALGAFVAGFSAPALLDGWGWRGIFFAGGLLPLALVVAMLLALPESLRLLVASKPGHHAIPDLLARLAPGQALASLRVVAHDLVEHRSVKALLAPAYRSRTLLLWGVFALNLLALYFLISWLPALLTGVGWSRDAALRGGVMIQLGGILGSVVISLLVDRGRAAIALLGAYVIATAALGGLVLLEPTVLHWTPLLALVGCGVSGGQLALYALASGFYPPAIRATGLGWSVGIGRLGAIVGPLLGGVLLQQQVSTPGVLGLLALPLIVCGIGAYLLPRHATDTVPNHPALAKESP